LPSFSAYAEDEDQGVSLEDAMSLMTQDVDDDNQDSSWSNASGGDTEPFIF
jgi:hypothetical protein